MINSLIEAHKELEEELQRAISDDCATQLIESIDRKEIFQVVNQLKKVELQEIVQRIYGLLL